MILYMTERECPFCHTNMVIQNSTISYRCLCGSEIRIEDIDDEDKTWDHVREKQ